MRKPYATYALVTIQVLLFIGMEVVGSSRGMNTLLLFGAKDNLLIAGYHQYFRLITPVFLHIGFTRLLLNSVTLWYLGREVESLIGSWKFLFVYFYSALMGNLFSYQFSPSLSAGASTALFGLFAFFLAMRRLYPHSRYYQVMGAQYQVLILMNIAMNLFSSGIDVWGHLGGVVGGFLATLFIGTQGKQGRAYKGLSLGVSAVIIGIILANHGYYNTLFH